jgi:hypothetical protein
MSTSLTTVSPSTIIQCIYDSNLALQERYFNPQYPALNPRLLAYTRGLDLSGSLAGAGGIGGLLARTDNGLLAIHNFEQEPARNGNHICNMKL